MRTFHFILYQVDGVLKAPLKNKRSSILSRTNVVVLVGVIRILEEYKSCPSARNIIEAMEFKYLIIFSLFVALLVVTIVQAQFFTKSSKSIPRMGRRSDESLASRIGSRRALIDNLIDEYGPFNLINALEVSKAK